jgi:hypothetical protein
MESKNLTSTAAGNDIFSTDAIESLKVVGLLISSGVMVTKLEELPYRLAMAIALSVVDELQPLTI